MDAYRRVSSRSNIAGSYGQGLSSLEAGSLPVNDLNDDDKKHRKPERWSGPYYVMGLEVTAELSAVTLVYLVQGLLHMSHLGVTFFLKDELRLGPSEVALLRGLSRTPWLIKPLYGFCTDTIPLWGYRRRSYLFACGLTGTAAWLALCGAVTTPRGVLAATFAASLSTAFSDVVVDSIVVERARLAPQPAAAASLQSLCWASSAIGSIFSAYFSGSLVQNFGPRTVFLVTAAFPLLTAVAACIIKEEPASTSLKQDSDAGLRQQLVQQAQALAAAMSQPAIFYSAVFVFFWQCTPSVEAAMFFFYTNRLGFSPEFLGRVRLVDGLAKLAGVWLFNQFLKEAPLRSIFFWTAVLGTGLGSTQLLLITGLNRSIGFSDEVFSLADSVLLTVLARISFMPVMVLAARCCPEGVEATLFATLMSVMNAAAVASSALGAALTRLFGVSATNFGNLAMLKLTCLGLEAVSLPLLRLLPAAVDR